MTRSLDEINTDIEATQKRIAEIRKLLNPNPINNVRNIKLIIESDYINRNKFKNLQVEMWSSEMGTFKNIIIAKFDRLDKHDYNGDIIDLDFSKKLRAIGYMAVTVNETYILFGEI